MRRASKVDRNQGEIVGALRAVGALVELLHQVGKGVPDLLVFSPFTSELHLLECKDWKKPPSARKLTAEQNLWHAAWSIRCRRIHVVNTVTQALEAIGAHCVADPY